jgi:hypothetical protein
MFFIIIYFNIIKVTIMIYCIKGITFVIIKNNWNNYSIIKFYLRFLKIHRLI